MADPEARFYITATDQTAAALRSAENGLRRIGTSVNQVRGAFRALGVALSARAIYRWVQDAIEVEKLSTQQAAAIGAATQAFKQLHNEFQGLARAAVTELAPALETAAKWWRQFLFPTDQESAQERIAEINDRVAQLTRTIRSLETGRQTEIKVQRAEQFRQEIRQLGEEMARMQAVANKPVEIIPNLSQDEWVRLESFLYELNNVKKDFSKGQKLSPELEQYIDDLKEAAQLTDGLRSETEKNLDVWREYKRLFENGIIDESTLNRLGDQLLEPVEVTAKRIQELKPEAEQWAKSLGDGMQSAFAGWLTGAETNFKDFLKRLAAEWVSSQVFGALGTLVGGPGRGSFLKSLFGGFRADGGPVSSGRAYVVGERGPELFVPGASGAVMAEAGGMTLNYAPVYNMGGQSAADPRLRAMLDENNRRQKAEIADLMRRGRFP